MLSRKTFAEAIGNIKKHEELMDKLNDVVREMGSFPPNLDFESLNREALLSVLKESMNDKYDYIGWWLYESTDDRIVSWEEDGKHEERNLKTVDALYDFLVEQTSKAHFGDLPIYEDALRETANDLFNYKVINKADFLTYFDRVFDYVDANEVALEIRGDSNDRYVLLSIRLYNKMMADKAALEEQMKNMEKPDGKRVCDNNG